MASALTHTATFRDAALDGMYDLLDGGSMKIYASGGSPPADATAAVVGTLLATVALSATAFAAASAGAKTLAGLPLSGAIVASGTADYYRLLKADGTTVGEQGSVATAGADLNFAGGVAFVSGGSVSITGYTATAFA